MNTIHAITIDQAWRETMTLCVKKGYDFVVKGGSYKGQIRRQLEYATIIIDNPSIRPLSPILPPGIPGPTSDEKIEKYFVKYLMNPFREENEVYTYGEFIQRQLIQVLGLLMKSEGNTNQATICIGSPETTFLDDPPCLRSISFKVVNGRLNMAVYFRSWDLFAGFPENLGGLQLLKEYVLQEFLIGVIPNIKDGKIIAFSDGLHLYEQYFSIVDCLNVYKIELDKRTISDKLRYIKEHGE